jgi:chromosomal replication initiation ATPase DnaA
MQKLTMGNSKSEKYIENYLKKEVEKRGGKAIKLLPFNFNGLPDRLCLLPGGRLFFAETKRANGKVKKLQGKVHEMLKNLGFHVYVIESISHVDEILYSKPWTDISLKTILYAVSKEVGIHEKIIISRNNGIRGSLAARQIVQYLASKLTDLSLTKIGEETGGFGHATVISNIKRAQDLIDTEIPMREKVDRVKNRLIC